jgi:signal transduction histidine kinase
MILGFAVLVATFAGLSVATTANMDRLNAEIRVIRTGYLHLALRSRDLHEKQAALLDYLRDELVGESTPRRVQSRIRRGREARNRPLDEIGRNLASQTAVPRVHEPLLDRSRAAFAQIRRHIRDTEPLYDVLLAAPPIERIVSGAAGPDVDPEALAAAGEALDQLRLAEDAIASQTGQLAIQQQVLVRKTAERLERGSRKLRLLTILFGAGAIALGLLIIVWAIWNLRPLRRLPAAAQRIARGDYGARIVERGPTEVADLAREFNKMAAAVESRERELVNSARLAAVGKMAAMITHEVRNPLSAIGLNTELLVEELGELDGERGAEARALCRAINTEVDRLAEITETYLEFARLPEPKLHPEDLNELVTKAVQFVLKDIESKGGEVVVTLDPGLPPVEIDHAQIRQALLNLLRNAAEALESVGGGRIEVSTEHRRDSRTVSLVVADNGPGITSDVLGKLFEPFFTTREDGTGLGLALTREIVRGHGGALEVSSRAGEGARFTFSLPLVSGPSILAD